MCELHVYSALGFMYTPYYIYRTVFKNMMVEKAALTTAKR